MFKEMIEKSNPNDICNAVKSNQEGKKNSKIEVGFPEI